MGVISFALLFSIFLPAPVKVCVMGVGSIFLFSGLHPARAPRRVQVVKPVPARVKKLPQAAQQPKLDLPPVKIIVNSDGSFIFNGQKITEEKLSKKLTVMASVTPQRKIILMASALTPHQMVANTIKMSQEAGMPNVSFAAAPDDTTP